MNICIVENHWYDRIHTFTNCFLSIEGKRGYEYMQIARVFMDITKEL